MVNLSDKDLKQLEKSGISLNKVEKQIKYFINGFPCVKLTKPCTIESGIKVLLDSEIEDLISEFDQECLKSRFIKFVPASGAASRMFKILSFFDKNFENINDTNIKILADNGDKEAKELYKFILNIRSFAFFDDLRTVMAKNDLDIYSLINQGEYKQIISFLLEEKGLNYSDLPKGLLKFHNYKDRSPRTAFEEHLVEGALYIKDNDNKVKIHFTVSPEHLDDVSNYINQVKINYEKELNVKFEITYSIQKKSTDTIAVDLENKPFYAEDKILFRPGGHGALIENLDDLKADIIFIKNIDNVVPDIIKDETISYKKALAGYLIKLQNKCFQILNNIDLKQVNLDDVYEFVEKDLCLNIPDILKSENEEKQLKYLYQKLNRPIRICGMVKNQGEPGGGPFWVQSDNTESLQIVESSQIDVKDEEQKKIFSLSTHFNPVDLVCGVKDYKGNNFDLENYIDHNTGFISLKSKDSKELKALELPGLWNGAMAYWNTIFVEVPLITFNPVKSVNDLLRKEHQILG